MGKRLLAQALLEVPRDLLRLPTWPCMCRRVGRVCWSELAGEVLSCLFTGFPSVKAFRASAPLSEPAERMQLVGPVLSSPPMLAGLQ